MSNTYYTAEAGEFNNEIQVGDVVVWQFVHSGRMTQSGHIGTVAAINGDVASVIDGALTTDVTDWNLYEVRDVKISRLGKMNVSRYARIGTLGK